MYVQVIRVALTSRSKSGGTFYECKYFIHYFTCVFNTSASTKLKNITRVLSEDKKYV